MTTERRQCAESLARAAMERPPGRPAFSADGCAGDEELRRKAESLLSFYLRAWHGDSAEVPDGLLCTIRAEPFAGRVPGQYRAERETGRGGMGEVYLARDTRLDRPCRAQATPAFTSLRAREGAPRRARGAPSADPGPRQPDR